MENLYLETLKARHQDAQKRMTAAQQKLAAVQAEFQSTAQEFNSLNYILAMEQQRQMQQDAATAQARQERPAIGPPTTIPAEPTESASANAPDVNNKTQLVRDVLRQSPNGMTPNEIWKQLEAQIGDHAYIYSVLKRLKDRDEVTKRRGKYCLKHHPEEVATQNGVAQQH